MVSMEEPQVHEYTYNHVTETILQSDCELNVNKGDTIINTPGGGGYGNPSKEKLKAEL